VPSLSRPFASVVRQYMRGRDIVFQSDKPDKVIDDGVTRS
jgi:hypothetical protein